MTARKIGMLLGLLVLLSSAVYVFVYLYRWEWNRALLVGMIFVATEVALATAVILERLQRLGAHGRPADRQAPPPDSPVLSRIRQTRPEPREPFAWLSPDPDRMGVFVPVLMGAGVVLAGLAWLVERIAARTATPVLEARLAHRLAGIALPTGGLVAEPTDSVHPWFVPGGDW